VLFHFPVLIDVVSDGDDFSRQPNRFFFVVEDGPKEQSFVVKRTDGNGMKMKTELDLEEPRSFFSVSRLLVHQPPLSTKALSPPGGTSFTSCLREADSSLLLVAHAD
jgi:hypothetical protein